MNKNDKKMAMMLVAELASKYNLPVMMLTADVVRDEMLSHTYEFASLENAEVFIEDFMVNGKSIMEWEEHLSEFMAHNTMVAEVTDLTEQMYWVNRSFCWVEARKLAELATTNPTLTTQELISQIKP